MGITGLARFVKFRGKTPTTESKFSTVVGQKPDALINIELFRKVFLGILSKFSGLFFKKKIYEELLLVLVNIWIRTITFTANIWKTITCIRLFSLSESLAYSSMFSFTTAGLSCFVLSISLTVVFQVCVLFYALFVYRLRQLITFILQRDENSSYRERIKRVHLKSICRQCT